MLKALTAFAIVVAVSAYVASFLIKPRPLTGRIMSRSMAAQWLGRHYALDCVDCQFPIRCDADFEPVDGKAVCPNCGARENPLRPDQIMPGDAVTIQRDSTTLTPQRWDVVAFSSPDPPHEMTVKRVIGLPGETIEIRDGEIYVEGTLLRKPIAVQNRVAQVVHNDRYRAGNATRWRSHDDSAWSSTELGYQFTSNKAQDEGVDWLEYVHQPTYPVPITADLPDESPVDDSYGYNQALARELHDVTDVMLQCKARCVGAGEVSFVAPDHRVIVNVLATEQRGILSCFVDGRSIAERELPHVLLGQSWRVEFSLFDHQVLFCLNGRILVDEQLSTEHDVRASSRPFRLGARALDAHIEDLIVLRDVYYLDPHGRSSTWRTEQPLPGVGYFLIGDNVPASRDSRHYADPAIRRNRLLGRALKQP